jgi:hypothetical protein
VLHVECSTFGRACFVFFSSCLVSVLIVDRRVMCRFLRSSRVTLAFLLPLYCFCCFVYVIVFCSPSGACQVWLCLPRVFVCLSVRKFDRKTTYYLINTQWSPWETISSLSVLSIVTPRSGYSSRLLSSSRAWYYTLLSFRFLSVLGIISNASSGAAHDTIYSPIIATTTRTARRFGCVHGAILATIHIFMYLHILFCYA